MSDERTGAERIAAERRRQIKEEGWSPEHDAKAHQYGDLAVVAATLAVFGTDARVVDPLWRGSYGSNEGGDPWGLERKHADDRVRQLEIAGALIAAEIDRLLRERPEVES